MEEYYKHCNNLLQRELASQKFYMKCAEILVVVAFIALSITLIIIN